jgi:hypothetical protein
MDIISSGKDLLGFLCGVLSLVQKGVARHSVKHRLSIMVGKSEGKIEDVRVWRQQIFPCPWLHRSVVLQT